MHHSTCVTAIWLDAHGFLSVSGHARAVMHAGMANPRCVEENVPDILGACSTRNFTYLARGPCGERLIEVPDIELCCQLSILLQMIIGYRAIMLCLCEFICYWKVNNVNKDFETINKRKPIIMNQENFPVKFHTENITQGVSIIIHKWVSYTSSFMTANNRLTWNVVRLTRLFAKLSAALFMILGVRCYRRHITCFFICYFHLQCVDLNFVS